MKGQTDSGNFFHRTFARVSPVFAACTLAIAAPCFSSAYSAIFLPTERPASSNASASADPTAAVRRQTASGQFARAEDQRATLNAKSADKRTLDDYKQVVNSYRRVYLITPHAVEVPDALLAVAELYTEMGDRWGRAYYQSAVDTYQFLLREYPASKYCQDAYLRSAKLQKDQLNDLAGASKTYEGFLKKFPRSLHKREAQEARAELALLQNSLTSQPRSELHSEPSKSAIMRSAESGGQSRETEKRSAARERASEKPRENTAVASADESAEPPVGRLSLRTPQVRRITSKSSPDSTRVVIEMDGSAQYVSGRIANPDRIYFDLHAARLAPQLLHAKIKADGALVSGVRVAQNPSGVVRVVLDINGVQDYSASLQEAKAGTSRLVVDLYASADAMRTAQANSPAASPTANSVAREVASAAPIPAEPAVEKTVEKVVVDTSGKTAKAETGKSADTLPQPKSKLGTAKIGKGNKPDLVTPASAPQPTRDGNATLTRALGLKIGRIVIDAGHGGHDTGTIGPSGLMEKDLCLDVALRLGKIIAQKLPSADVVYTRSDDSFIPLEERTHIANESKADMFISIHANSSRDPEARGIETYYLNLKGSAEAMEVAARENATDDQGIHELQDLVKQIARTEKIDESREFASDVQESLAKRLQRTARTLKNRGVRKAPFVVLIGADMPSILTEISFLSNPSDERLLKQPEHRQRVAEGIYQGVASYLQSLNSMGVNQSTSPLPKRTETSAAVESSGTRN